MAYIDDYDRWLHEKEEDEDEERDKNPKYKLRKSVEEMVGRMYDGIDFPMDSTEYQEEKAKQILDDKLNRLTADFLAACSKMKISKTSNDFAELRKEFIRISRDLQPVIASEPSVRDAIYYCEQGRKQCEEEMNQLKKDETFSRFNKAKTRIPNMQKTYEYDGLAAEFFDILQAFKSLPSSFDVQAEIEECENYRKQCEEKMNQFKKVETIAWFNKAKNRILPVQKTYEYDGLLSEFTGILKVLLSLPSSFDIKAEIEECENYRKQCEEKMNEIKREETLVRLDTAKQKIPNMQTTDEYDGLASEFTSILKIFLSLSNSFDVQAEIEECKNCREQCEEKSNQIKREKTLARLNTAKEKISNVQTTDEYDKLATEFDNISEDFKLLSSSIDVQAEIEECENCRKKCYENCEEIKNQLKKDGILSRFNIAKREASLKRSVQNYEKLAKEFVSILYDFQSLPSSFDVQAEIEECRKFQKQYSDKVTSKQRRIEVLKITKKMLLSVLYFAIVSGLITLVYLSRTLDEEIGRGVLTIIFVVAGGWIGFTVVSEENSGCLAVLLGIPIGAIISGLIGYFLIGGFFSLLATIGVLWIIIAIAILVLSIIFYRKFGEKFFK